MVVRIRFGKGPKVGKKRQKNKRLALAVAALLPPAAFLAGVLGAWRIAADLNWTPRVFFRTGRSGWARRSRCKCARASSIATEKVETPRLPSDFAGF